MDFPFLKCKFPSVLCIPAAFVFSRIPFHQSPAPPKAMYPSFFFFFFTDLLILKAEYLQSLKSNNYHVVDCKNTHIFLLFL